MARPDTSEVTEEEFEALLHGDPEGGDGEESEEPASDVDEESDAGAEEEPAEQEEGNEASEAEEEDEEAPEETPEHSWDSLEGTWHKTEYERVAAEAERYKKAHSKLQSDFTKRSQAEREEVATLSEVRTKAESFDQWNQILSQHPEVQKAIEEALAKVSDPLKAVQMPDYLQSDPALQYIKQAYEPVIQSLRAELAQVKQQAGKVGEWEKREQDTANRQKLDSLINDAGEKFKSMFQRDWSEDEKTDVLRYMVENKYYQSGKNAALAVFADQYEKTLASKANANMAAKAKKFPARNKTVNSARAVKNSQDASTPEEAIQRALADQGYGI